MLVYVVDDDDAFLTATCATFARYGIEAVPMTDAASCVVALSGEAPPPDLVLLDLELPVVDGHELIAMIRAHPRGKKVRVIATAAVADTPAARRAVALGADGCVQKPVSVPDLTERYLSADRQPPAFATLRRVAAAVLFADLRGFSAFTAQHDPETVVDVLTGLFDIFFADIRRVGGHVDKVVGDGVLALFGAPGGHDDPVYAAILAARAMRSNAEAFCHDSVLLAGRTSLVGVGAGIAYGEVVAGLVGPTGHKAYTAVGDPVNRASRLQGSAGPGEILLGRAAADQVSDRVEMDAQWVEDLKGMGPVEVFRVARTTVA